jgi:hypothetical protein
MRERKFLSGYMRLISCSGSKGKFGQLRKLNADLRPAISGSGNRFKTNGPDRAAWPGRHKISKILVRFQQWLDKKTCRCHFWYQSPGMLPVFSVGQNKADFGWLNKESARRAIDAWLEDCAQLNGAILFQAILFPARRKHDASGISRGQVPPMAEPVCDAREGNH